VAADYRYSIVVPAKAIEMARPLGLKFDRHARRSTLPILFSIPSLASW
jgi:hypothetical protein